MAAAVLYVCITCRRAETSAESVRPGMIMLQTLQALPLPSGVEIRGVECLSACDHGCSVALAAADKWTYVYGRLDPAQDAEAILAGAELYADSIDGLVPWRARPAIFRKQVLARIPPFLPLHLPETPQD